METLLTPENITLCVFFVAGMRKALSDDGVFGWLFVWEQMIYNHYNKLIKVEPVMCTCTMMKNDCNCPLGAKEQFKKNPKRWIARLVSYIMNPIRNCEPCMCSVWGCVFFLLMNSQLSFAPLLVFIPVVSGVVIYGNALRYFLIEKGVE